MKLIINVIVFIVLALLLVAYLSIICLILYFNSNYNPSKRLEKKVVIFCKKACYHLFVSIFGYWFPNPVFIKYDETILKKSRSIIISNHCSDYDWLFLFIVLKELGKYESFKLLLKRSLASVPLIGMGLKKFGHIFLNRQRSKDIQIIKNALRNIDKDPNTECDVMLYPEGTYMYKEAIEGSKKFAQKAQIKIDNEVFIPENVLLPRKTGFNLIRGIFGKSLDGIIDMTIFVNPYVRRPCEECSHFDFFFKQKKELNQFIFLNWVPAEKLDENFLFKSFSKKDKMIGSYLKYSEKLIKTQEDFEDIVSKISPKQNNEKIKTLYVYSPYKAIFLTFPIAILIYLLKVFN